MSQRQCSRIFQVLKSNPKISLDYIKTPSGSGDPIIRLMYKVPSSQHLLLLIYVHTELLTIPIRSKDTFTVKKHQHCNITLLRKCFTWSVPGWIPCSPQERHQLNAQNFCVWMVCLATRLVKETQLWTWYVIQIASSSSFHGDFCEKKYFIEGQLQQYQTSSVKGTFHISKRLHSTFPQDTFPRALSKRSSLTPILHFLPQYCTSPVVQNTISEAPFNKLQ